MSSTTLLTLSPFLILGAALSYVVGTAWNDAVQSGITKYYPNKNENFGAKVVYAIGITIIMIILVAILNVVYQKSDYIYTKIKSDGANILE